MLTSAKVKFLYVINGVLKYKLILIFGAPLSLLMLLSERWSLSYSGSSELVEPFDSSSMFFIFIQLLIKCQLSPLLTIIT